MVELLAAGAGETPTRLLLCPNPPLSRRGQRLLLGGLAAVMAVYGVLLASRGFWPILPFAVLELAAVALALRLTARRAGRAELVEIDASDLRIQWQERADGATVAFASGWARVRLVPGGGRWLPPRLLVGAHGRWVELGSFLTAEERQRTARLIERALAPHSAW